MDTKQALLKILSTCIILIFTSINGYTQKYALISSFTMKPVVYSEKVTSKDLRLGKFPVLKADYDSFIAELKTVLGYYDRLRNQFPVSDFDHSIGDLHVIGTQSSRAYGYRMSVHVTNKLVDETIGMRLTGDDEANIENYQKLARYIKMLEDNRIE